MAISVMVSGGSVSRIRRISRCEGDDDGVKRREVLDVEGSTEAAVDESKVPGGGESNRCFQVSDGLE